MSGRTVGKAALSSLLASAVDGLVYELGLLALPSHYGFAALLGAVAGGVSNFSVNRYWTFQAQAERGRSQAMRYALVSLATFLSLRTLLWLFVEVLGMSAELAWLPAKVLAFLLVSYPTQRVWVFAPRTETP